MDITKILLSVVTAALMANTVADKITIHYLKNDNKESHNTIDKQISYIANLKSQIVTLNTIVTNKDNTITTLSNTITTYKNKITKFNKQIEKYHNLSLELNRSLSTISKYKYKANLYKQRFIKLINSDINYSKANCQQGLELNKKISNLNYNKL